MNSITKWAGIAAISLGIGGGLGSVCDRAYNQLMGRAYVTVDERSYQAFSEIIQEHEQAKDEYNKCLARKVREIIDPNGDGHVTREEVGLPPAYKQ